MLKKITFPILVLITASLFSSCSRDNTISNSESLVGTWAVTGIRSDIAYDWDGDGRSENDIYATYSSCQRDIILVFEDGGYGQARQGCNAPWENSSWYLGNNNSRLDITIPSGDINLDISQYSSNTIRGTDQVEVNGRYYTITYTLSRR